MDFFQYASYAGIFTNVYWIRFLTGGLCFALVFAFQAIALYTIASREGYKNRWMAFIPFLNTYYIGVCAQKNRFYNIDTKKIALAAAIFEAVLFSLFIVYYTGCFIILDSDIAPIVATDIFGVEIYEYNMEIVPSSLKWAAWMYNYMYDYILRFLDLVFMLMRVVILSCFFQTYACRQYVIFTVTSILFPIQGILFFVVKDNKGTNYKQFVEARQARYYQMYQQQQQQYYNQNPYSRNPNYQNPYSGNPPPPQSKSDDPFEDFPDSSGGNGGSPFDDFN